MSTVRSDILNRIDSSHGTCNTLPTCFEPGELAIRSTAYLVAEDEDFDDFDDDDFDDEFDDDFEEDFDDDFEDDLDEDDDEEADEDDDPDIAPSEALDDE